VIADLLDHVISRSFQDYLKGLQLRRDPGANTLGGRVKLVALRFLSCPSSDGKERDVSLIMEVLSEASHYVSGPTLEDGCTIIVELAGFRR
jgi:hypothetical protein